MWTANIKGKIEVAAHGGGDQGKYLLQ